MKMTRVIVFTDRMDAMSSYYLHDIPTTWTRRTA